MRSYLLTATALTSTLIGFVPSTTFAQDAAAFDWSGFYAGFSAGVLQQGSSATMTYPAAGTPPTTTGFHFSGNSLLSGGTTLVTGLPEAFALNTLAGTPVL